MSCLLVHLFFVLSKGEEKIREQKLKDKKRVLTDALGQTGSGKSTFVNTLFNSHLIDSKGPLKINPEQTHRQTTEIVEATHGSFFFPPLFFSSMFRPTGQSTQMAT